MTPVPSLARLRAVVALVGLVALVAGSQAAAGRPGDRGRHTVARGETLSEVAARLGVSTEALARVNGITDVDRVRAGRRLRVPPAGRKGAPPRQGRRAGARAPEDLRQRPERLSLMAQFDAAGREFGVPPALLKAVAWQESGWQNDKVSVAQAYGIGQLMPATVSFVNDRLLGYRLDPLRAEHNIRMSARFLSYLLSRTNGDPAAAVGAYFQGLASLRRNGPSPATQRYVANVLALQRKF